MTPEQHYEQAEWYAKKAALPVGNSTTHTYAILAVAHALMAMKTPPPVSTSQVRASQQADTRRWTDLCSKIFH